MFSNEKKNQQSINNGQKSNVCWWKAQEQADQSIYALLAPISPPLSVPVEIDLNPQPCGC